MRPSSQAAQTKLPTEAGPSRAIPRTNCLLSSPEYISAAMNETEPKNIIQQANLVCRQRAISFAMDLAAVSFGATWGCAIVELIFWYLDFATMTAAQAIPKLAKALINPIMMSAV